MGELLEIDFTPTATYEPKQSTPVLKPVELDSNGKVILKKRGRKSSVENAKRERTSMLLKQDILTLLRKFVDNNKKTAAVKYITLAQIYDEALDQWIERNITDE